MATEAYINIKQLPEINQIENGSYLIVETPEGTNILDFKNFIITPTNTTFASQLSGGTEAIIYATTLVNSLCATIESTLASNYPKVFSDFKRVVLNDTNNTTTILNKPVPISVAIRASDIIITPGNETAALSAAYIDSINFTPINNSDTRMCTVKIKSPYTFSSYAPGIFNLAVVKTY